MVRPKYFLIGLVFLAGCFRNPAPPSLDNELNLPITSETILMTDICDSIPNDSIALFDTSYAIDTLWARDFLVLDSITHDTLISFSNIFINSSYNGTTAFTLGELYPALIPYNDSLLDSVPGAPFNASHFLFLDQPFTNATVDSGDIMISITNNFPVDIESLRVLVLPDTLIFDFNDLAVGETRADSTSLSGMNITNPVTCELSGKTASGNSILIDTSDAILADVEVKIHTLRSLTGEFPSDTVEMKVPVPLAPYRLYTANIDSGYFKFSLFSAMKDSFVFLLKGTECSFLPFTCPIQRGPNDSIFRLDNVSINPEKPDTLKLMGYILPLPFPAVDTLDDLDTFALSIKFSDLYLSLLQGKLDTVITSEIPGQGDSIDYGDFDPTGIEFQNVWLYLKLWSNIDAKPQLNLRLLGMRGTQSESLHLQITVNPGENYIKIPGDSVINGSSVKKFVNLFPESIDVSGEVALTGDVNVKAEDFVYGEFGIEVPIDFILKDTLVFEPESLRIELHDEIREADIVDTRLLLYYNNSLPLKGDLTLFLSTDSTVYGDTMLKIPIQEDDNYRYNEPIDIQKFLKEEVIWGRLLVRFYPDTVSALITDKFSVSTLLKVKLRVGK